MKEVVVITPPKDTTKPQAIDTISPIVTFDFIAKVNNTPFIANSQWYTNSSSDSFTVSKFNYYISNVKLKRADGSFFAEQESYHLIKHVDGATTFSFTNIPQGNYTSIEFLIGVDSLRNVSGAQTGALDVANNMFWEWNSGYIFFKLEGLFNSLTQSQKAGYAIHIGGFKGRYSCLQKCSFNLSSPLIAKNNRNSKLTYDVNLEKLFNSATTIGFDYYYANITEGMFQQISFNYKEMFAVNKIEN
jgi:hypothetical protein